MDSDEKIQQYIDSLDKNQYNQIYNLVDNQLKHHIIQFKQLIVYFNFKFYLKKLLTDKNTGGVQLTELYLIDKEWLRKWKRHIGYKNIKKFYQSMKRNLFLDEGKDNDWILPVINNNFQSLKLIPLDNSKIFINNKELNLYSEFVIVDKNSFYKLSLIFKKGRQNEKKILNKNYKATIFYKKIILTLDDKKYLLIIKEKGIYFNFELLLIFKTNINKDKIINEIGIKDINELIKNYDLDLHTFETKEFGNLKIFNKTLLSKKMNQIFKGKENTDLGLLNVTFKVSDKIQRQLLMHQQNMFIMTNQTISNIHQSNMNNKKEKPFKQFQKIEYNKLTDDLRAGTEINNLSRKTRNSLTETKRIISKNYEEIQGNINNNIKDDYDYINENRSNSNNFSHSFSQNTPQNNSFNTNNNNGFNNINNNNLNNNNNISNNICNNNNNGMMMCINNNNCNNNINFNNINIINQNMSNTNQNNFMNSNFGQNNNNNFNNNNCNNFNLNNTFNNNNFNNNFTNNFNNNFNFNNISNFNFNNQLSDNNNFVQNNFMSFQNNMISTNNITGNMPNFNNINNNNLNNNMFMNNNFTMNNMNMLNNNNMNNNMMLNMNGNMQNRNMFFNNTMGSLGNNGFNLNNQINQFNMNNMSLSSNLNSISKSQKPLPHKIGLQNIGQTCYMNASLQCLTNIETLSNDLLTKLNNKCINVQQQPLTFAYTSLLFEFKNTNQKYINPQTFKTTLGALNPLFQGNQASDAKDFIFFVIETLHQELKPPDNNMNSLNQINFFQQEIEARNQILTLNKFLKEFRTNSSIISDLFYGITRSIMKCEGCNNEKYSFQTFNILNFILKKVREDKNQMLGGYLPDDYTINLFDAFECENKKEDLTGENMIYCNTCKALKNGWIQQNIYQLPKIMIIILNRGKNNRDFRKDFKIDEILNFNNPNSPNNIICNVNNQKIYTKYFLCGIVKHLGESGSNGHFISYFRNDTNQKFYCYNDASVSEVPIEDATKTIISGREENDVIPYILFYHYKR